MSTIPPERLTVEERRALARRWHVRGERGCHASSIDDIAPEGGRSKALTYEHPDFTRGLAAAIAEAGPGNVDRLETGLDRPAHGERPPA